jgi:outer membrane protein TolC
VPRRLHRSFFLPSALAGLLLWLWYWGSPAQAAERVRPEDARLSLGKAAQVGATRNLNLLSQDLVRRRQQVLERAAWAAYSPTLLLDSTLDRSWSGERSFGTHVAGVAFRAPTGTRVRAEGITRHLYSGEGDAQGALILAVTQPLLRDGWLTGAALPLRESALLADLQRELFRQSLNGLLVEIEAAYWDLAVAEADLIIKTRSQQRAVQQFEDTRENIRRGILAEAEIYVVEENVVFFDQELRQAEENLRRGRRRLAEVLLYEADVELAAADPLTRPTFVLPEAEAAVAVALERSPLLGAQRLRRTLSETRRAWAANQTLPALDLTGQLTLAGADTAVGPAWRGTLADPGPDTRVGLSFSLPLDRGAISATLQGATLDAQRQGVELAAAENQLRFEVFNVLGELDTHLTLLTMAEKQVELAELKLGAETDKYQSGIGTLADVVRFQRDLDNALIRVQRVIRTLNVGRARLLASQGVLHEVMGVGVGR